MNKKEKNRFVVLLALLGVFSVVALVQMWGRDGLTGADTAIEELSYEPRDFPNLIATDVDDGASDDKSADRRNLFTYGKPPTPTPNLTPQPTPEPQPTRRGRLPTPVSNPTPTPRGPRPPQFDREFIGHFGPDRLKVAAFRRQGEEDVTLVDVAIVGQIIDDKFIVREIGLESVLIGYVGFDPSEDTRVPLAEE